MMKSLFYLMIGFCVEANAQDISGIVTDEKNEPVAFASVALLQANDSSFVAGVTTDMDGRFKINGDPDGKLLKVSYVGYATQILQPAQDMSIVLKEEGVTIGNVVITGSRPGYKMKGGALVAPVENTVLGKLGYAPDVLAQLPLVSKNSGGYQVVGRGKPLIYINNRQMRDEKELEEIKSSDIKEIKVDLNPGSQYSAEVGAIIKITTIRPTGEGLGGQFMTNWRHNATDSWYGGGSLNYRFKALDLFFNGRYSRSSLKQTQFDMTSFSYKNTLISASQDGDIIIVNKYIDLTGGFSYSPNSHQLMGLRYNYASTLDFDGDCNFKGIYTKDGEKSDFSTYQSLGIPVSKDHQANAFYQNEISEQWKVNIDATFLNTKENKNGHQTENREGVPAVVNSQTKRSSNLWAIKAWSTNRWLGGTAEWGLELTNTRNEQSYLMLNEDIVLSRESIMTNVWGTDFEGESRTVDMHIKTLRQKLGECGKQIRTIRGVGYAISKECGDDA